MVIPVKEAVGLSGFILKLGGRDGGFPLLSQEVWWRQIVFSCLRLAPRVLYLFTNVQRT